MTEQELKEDAKIRRVSLAIVELLAAENISSDDAKFILGNLGLFFIAQDEFFSTEEALEVH